MAKQYDATLKQLLEARPLDWLNLADLPHGDGARIVDSDVSTVNAVADKVLIVEGPEPYIAHIEFQSRSDASFDRRMLLYNVLLGWRHQMPVRTVAVLLTPGAANPVTGTIVETLDERHALSFAYRVVRAWELSPDALLAGGFGTIPLLPLAIEPAKLGEAFSRARERLDAALAPPDAEDLMTAMYIMSGVRFERRLVDQVLSGVRNMEESSTYQGILEKGAIRGVRHALVRAGRRRFGEPGPEVIHIIDQIEDLERLESLMDHVSEVSNWGELMATLLTKR